MKLLGTFRPTGSTKLLGTFRSKNFTSTLGECPEGRPRTHERSELRTTFRPVCISPPSASRACPDTTEASVLSTHQRALNIQHTHANRLPLNSV